MNEEVFKMYDIRGIYPDELDEDVAYKIGRAFVRFLGKEKPYLIIGRDGRMSSPSLFEALKKGITDSGGRVTDTGVSNTPLLNFAVAKTGCDGGVMVTASHNPAEFNGFKLVKQQALQLYGKDIQKIKEIILKSDYQTGEGEVVEKSFLSQYTDHLLIFAQELKDLKIVVDCGNGVGGVTAVPLFEKLPVEAVFLHEQIDGSFPNRPPDPSDEKLKEEVSKKVVEESADLGVLFDGDADRCVLIDEKGETVAADTLLSLLATEELQSYPGGRVYYDLRFSMTTSEAIKEAGGEPVMMRVGNPFYKEKIVKDGGILGAELSGHIMFKENFGIDDGLFALIKTLTVVQKKGEKLSLLLAPFKKYFQTEEINLKVKDKQETLRKVKSCFEDGESVDVDGVYIRYQDWWFNLRESNTEDLVRLRIEAKTKKLLEEKREQIISLI